ncbi:sarcosine oxidase subunit gamma [Tistlia consotensis]|uniref:Sarcosine oxidase subunit gamma n=1 Tax=Tistlia consotensis USBA 355 TaxID=560819 RepID=A0A1Y6BM02_9PROT|nr:sarcosine oxidase subunit gamma family protein [Tistlia consotensis]SMF18000.1 sarcosine oxidase subunit gamma [Tistlia consotensis USBA 355]SNR40028.1 sarcosine oxidase subunit gamma [Tistlia consotensis]
MPEILEHHSALAHLGLAARAVATRDAGQGVGLAEAPYRAAVNLRGRLDDAGFAAGAEQALGCALPAEVGAVATAGELSALALGPGEWLVVGGSDGPALRARLLAALEGVFASVVEVGQQYATIRIAGPKAAETLQKGCPLDFDAAAFPAGRCAQSLLSKIDVLVWKRSEEPAFEVTVRRSFADYAWRWLHDAAREYGVAILAG